MVCVAIKNDRDLPIVTSGSCGVHGSVGDSISLWPRNSVEEGSGGLTLICLGKVGQSTIQCCDSLQFGEVCGTVMPND